MILSKMVCFYRAESQMESHSGRAKSALFGQQAAHRLRGPAGTVHPNMDTT